MDEVEEIEFCPHCGEDMEVSLMPAHIRAAHSVGRTRAQERLETHEKGKGKVIGGVIVAALVIFAGIVALGMSGTDNSTPTGPADTEDTPNIVDLGGDGDGSGDGGGGGDGTDGTSSGDGGDTSSGDGGDPSSGDGGDTASGDGDDDTQSQLPPDDDEEELAYEIPVDDVETDAKWYSHMSPDDIEIRYFCVLGSDGEIHIAFDACDVCYEANLGYRQDGNNMKCNNCDKPFPIRAIGTENQQGGCWPAYLPMKIEDGNIIIKVADLEEGEWLFTG